MERKAHEALNPAKLRYAQDALLQVSQKVVNRSGSEPSPASKSRKTTLDQASVMEPFDEFLERVKVELVSEIKAALKDFQVRSPPRPHHLTMHWPG